MKKHLIKLLKGQTSITDIWYYMQGNIRHKLYYSRFRWLIRRHIREQIAYRITWMDEECFDQGSCKKCGCMTTALQMCNKSCEKPCYPRMLSKYKWYMFINKEMWINNYDGTHFRAHRETKEPLLYKEEKFSYVPCKRD